MDSAFAAGPLTIVAKQTLEIDVPGGFLIQLPADAASMVVANPSIADVRTPTAFRVFLLGKKPGRTAPFALSSNGAPSMATKVDPRHPQAWLQAQIRAEAGDCPVILAHTAEGAVLHGAVPDLAVAVTVGGNVPLVDQLRVAGAVQVSLRVRVAEVSRSASRQLGFTWSTGRFTTTGATLVGIDGVFGTVASQHVNASAVPDATADAGLVTMLAEPSLTAIPGATSIECKRYGVGINFTPTVPSTSRISMKLRFEASAIRTTNAISLNNVVVPAPTSRETEVERAELRDRRPDPEQRDQHHPEAALAWRRAGAGRAACASAASARLFRAAASWGAIDRATR